ncbi:MAG: metalloregulator ArsR/SmtB family transcription factor [Pseudomonadota bacterium]
MPYESKFAALAHPLRQKILTSLGDAPKSVRELTDDFSLSQPAISQHLKVLREAGLIEGQTHGAKNIYAPRPESLGDLRRYIEQHWAAILQSLDDDEEDTKDEH